MFSPKLALARWNCASATSSPIENGVLCHLIMKDKWYIKKFLWLTCRWHLVLCNQMILFQDCRCGSREETSWDPLDRMPTASNAGSSSQDRLGLYGQTWNFKNVQKYLIHVYAEYLFGTVILCKNDCLPFTKNVSGTQIFARNAQLRANSLSPLVL